MRDDRDYYKKKADGVDQEVIDAVKILTKSVKEISEVTADIQADLRRRARDRG